MTPAYPMTDPSRPRLSSALSDVFDRHGVRVRFARDQEIYRQGDAVEMLYRIQRGVVRTSRVTIDGRRQVGAFYYAGDAIGLEPGPDHRFGAEALADCEIVAVRRSAVRDFAGEAELDRAILEANREEMERLQDHVVLLGRRGARERVACFLMAMANGDQGQIEIPMSRQDIADYLGLTIETVSRMITQLQDEDLVAFPSTRRFQIRKWNTLEAMAA